MVRGHYPRPYRHDPEAATGCEGRWCSKRDPEAPLVTFLAPSAMNIAEGAYS
jgi:hypothetical protein